MDIAEMSEERAESAFQAIRFASTGGEPFCAWCRCEVVYRITRNVKDRKTGAVTTRRLFKCKKCLKQFYSTSGAIFHARKLSFKKIMLGTLVYVNGVGGVAALHMRRDLRCNHKIAWLLRKKVYHVLGNHDCLGVFPKSGIDPSAPDYGKQFYIDRFGPRYYGFDHKGVHFVVLDTVGLTADRSYEGRIDAEQLGWLRADLAAQPQGTRIIAVAHIPLLSAMQCYEPEAWLDTPHNWTFAVNGREVLRLFKDHDVLAVLQAHSHAYERIELNGISFITTGAVAGAYWRGSFLGTPEGYTEITVSGRTVQSRYRTYGFNSVDRQDVPI